MVETFGLTYLEALNMALLGLMYAVFSLFPFIWPAFVSYRSSAIKSYRFRFCVVVGLMVYGVLTAVSACLGVPVKFLLVYIVPQLEAGGYPLNQMVISALRFFADYGWLGIPVLIILGTILITHRFSRSWERLVIAWQS